MTDLYQSQVALRLNNNPHSRGNAIRVLIDTLSRDEIKRKKEQFEDRGKPIISDCYTKDELIMVSRYFLQTNALEDLRNRFDFLIGHSMLARGESKRQTQLPDLFLVELLNEGPTPCWALVVTTSEGKTNSMAVLNMDLSLDTSTLKAVLLVQWHYTFSRVLNLLGNLFPIFLAVKTGMRFMCLKVKTALRKWLCRTQQQAYKRALENVGINSLKVTHINRGSALNLIDEESISDNQQRGVGR
ncbi:hypothetical protein G6F56_009842 [Rhizopus delemar]|nr:hypothetical protein G6F56_009842 [Rhizopus delemar]